MDRRQGPLRVGLIGYPIKHSISPVFQQAAFDFHGIDAHYEAWETPPDQVQAAVERLRQDGYLGMNVTVPHKQAVMPLLDDIDPMAQRIGAVNTIVKRDGRLVGFNTDANGFLRSLEREAGYYVVEKRVLVIGAGGAARAVVFALAEASARSITIANRRQERSGALVDELKAQFRDLEARSTGTDELELEEAIENTDLLVNATSVGMRHTQDEEATPLPKMLLRPELLVCDLVYNPLQTALLRAAEQIGAATLSGLPMLVYQGAAAFELWTGRVAPVGLMFERAREALRD